MIPKTIHFCWLSGDPYPPLIQKCIHSWKEKLPDYQLRCWDKQAFDLDSIPWTKEAFSVKKYAFASDYIRLYALYHHGGIYLDTDVEVFKKFDDLLHLRSFMGWESCDIPEAAVLGAQKGMDWVKQAMSYYENKSFILPNGSMSLSPAPLIIQNVLKSISSSEYLRRPDEKKCEIPELGLSLFPSVYFSPKDNVKGRMNIQKETYCVHYFNAEWVDKNFYYYLKKYIHRLIIFFFGKKIHKKSVEKIRKKKGVKQF